MKGTVKVLSSNGHDTIVFDTEQGIVQEAEDALILAARNRSAVFDTSTREQVPGNVAAGSPGDVLSEHEELLVIPPMAGGQ
jgi:hypothetical protein